MNLPRPLWTLSCSLFLFVRFSWSLLCFWFVRPTKQLISRFISKQYLHTKSGLCPPTLSLSWVSSAENIFIIVAYWTNILSHNHVSLDAIFWVVILRLNIITTSQFSLYIETIIIIDWVATGIPILQRVYKVFQLLFSRSLLLSNWMVWKDDTYRTTCIALQSLPNLCSNIWLSFIKLLRLLGWFILVYILYCIRHELIQSFKLYVMSVDVLSEFIWS